MAKKISKKTKRRLVTLVPVALFIIGYFIFNVFAYSYNLIKLKNNEVALNEQLDFLKDSEHNLQIELQKLKDPDYIARYARENYLYSKDGEYIIKLNKDDKAKEIVDEIKDDKYYMFYGLGVVIIGFIGFKKLNNKKKKKH